MSSRTRYALVVLSAVGLAASVAALYVHYQVDHRSRLHELLRRQRDGECEQVSESAYGTVPGVPVAAGGAIWSAFVFLLAA